MRHTAMVCFALLASLSTVGAQLATTDAMGRLKALSVAGVDIDVRTALLIPTAGWERQAGQGGATEVKTVDDGDLRAWTGQIEPEPGKPFGFRQTLRETQDAVELSVSVTADTEVETGGVYLMVDVSVADFSSGSCVLSRGEAPAGDVALPATWEKTQVLGATEADLLQWRTADGATTLRMSPDRAVQVTLQDNREWGDAHYRAFFRLAPTLKIGETTSLTLTLRASAALDQTPASLTVDAQQVRYQFDGFGGNYCFAVESPVTQYTLNNLKVAWARTLMSLDQWEPENDNGSPVEANWPMLTGQDRPDSNLRREFELAGQIQDMGVRCIATIWRLPSWLYAEPPKPNNVARGTVAPGKWPEFCECIGTYLSYAKSQYAVEPDLLCLNWPNIGTSIVLSPEEYAYVVKGIGDYLQRLGLPTRMVLGDLSEPRSTLAYVTPASEDPEAVAQVGAVGIHTWGGASAEQYAAWADLAQRLDVPLLVTALGVDPDAWADHAFEAYGYALREAKTYQEVLLSARPRGTMQWEFSGDYPLLQAGGAPDGSLLLKPTARYSFVRHFCNLTPYASEALATTSDGDKVLVTAFRGQEEQQGQFTVHILNNGPAREAALTGLPAEIGSLRAVVTNGDEWFVDQEPVTISEGTAKLNLKPASLLTLTTMEGG